MHPFWPSAITGAVGGGLGSLLSGAKDSKDVIRQALAAAAISGGIGGGGYEAGKALVGAPDPNDPSGYTKRSALGGGLGGAAIGGGLGALAHSIKPNMVAEAGELVDKSPYLLKLLRQFPRGRAALLGAGALGAFGAYQGAEEGMIQDAIQREKMRSQNGF